MNDLWIYGALALVTTFSVAVDFFGHKGKEMTVKSASLWSGFYIGLGLLFGGGIYLAYGGESASMYYSGYLLEKALSVDNLLVFTAIFASFGITCTNIQHKILLWGIAGAIIFRGIFTAVGVELMNVHWSIHTLFGAIIVFTAIKMMLGGDDPEVDGNDHPVTKWVSNHFPVAKANYGAAFFVRQGGKLLITPLLLCMLVIELSDVMFAFDSVPAIIGITQEPALVYSAMVMAILGLRALYFVLQVLLDKLPLLNAAVIVCLLFVGIKMILASALAVHIPAMTSLIIVGCILALGCIPIKES